MPFVAQPTEKCTACGRTVYATEKTVVDDKEVKKIYHKTCIRCKECNKVLSLGDFTAVDGVFFCKPHFKQLFASKGNYDESFGKEKVSSKWDGQSGGIPNDLTGENETKSEKNQTSEATVALFKKFREEGDANKCEVCDKTVYLAEKLLVENNDGKLLFHKACFKCNVCELTLDLRNYGSKSGKIYCKNHLKEASGISSPASGYVPSQSFVPLVESAEIEKKTDKKETSEATGLSDCALLIVLAAIFKKFREEGDSNKCTSCGKTVYVAEKLLVENKNDKYLFHKACFKCSVCDLTLDLRNYGSIDDKIFCKNHLKEIGVMPKTGSGGTYLPASKSFVPEVKEQIVTEKGSTPEHIAAKFKGLGQQGEKCKLCGKTVYATEKLTIEELNRQSIFHKSCFRCSKCNIQLDISTFGSAGGVIYCKVHLKEFGKPEAAKEGGIFISPLAVKDENYLPGTREDPSNDLGEYKDEIRSEQESEQIQQSELEPEQTRESELELGREDLSREESLDPEEIEKKRKEADRARRLEERRREQEEEERKYEESRQRRQNRLSQSLDSPPSDLGVDGDDKEEERRKKREERERQRLEEEKRYQEEKDKRDREREERRRQREDEERREEEERERRKQEREERRKQQEEQGKRELEEEERKAQERRQRLAQLKDS